MKSYIQGLITGAVFVFAIFVFIGATNASSGAGRYDGSMAWRHFGNGN